MTDRYLTALQEATDYLPKSEQLVIEKAYLFAENITEVKCVPKVARLFLIP